MNLRVCGWSHSSSHLDFLLQVPIPPVFWTGLQVAQDMASVTRGGLGVSLFFSPPTGCPDLLGLPAVLWSDLLPKLQMQTQTPLPIRSWPLLPTPSSCLLAPQDLAPSWLVSLPLPLCFSVGGRRGRVQKEGGRIEEKWSEKCRGHHALQGFSCMR